MKKKIDTYLFSELIKISLLTLFSLLVLFFVFKLFETQNSQEFLNASFQSVLIYSLLNIPIILNILIIPSIIIGFALTLSILNERNEILIFFASGLSKKEITIKVSSYGMILSVFLIIIFEALAPVFDEKSKDFQSLIYPPDSIQTSGVLWIKKRNSFIALELTSNDQVVRDFKSYEFSPDLLLQKFQHSGDIISHGEALEIKNTTSLNLKKDGDIYTIDKEIIDNQDFNISLNESLIKGPMEHSKAMSLRELVLKIYFLSKNEVDTKIFEIELISRLIRPLIIFTIIMFVMPYLLVLNRVKSIQKTLSLSVFLLLVSNFIIKFLEALAIKSDFNHLFLVTLPVLIVLLFSWLKINQTKDTIYG